MPVKKAATPRNTTKRTLAGDRAVVRPTDEEIRVRAYQIYLQRNGHPGDPAEDWLRAEMELLSTFAVPAARPKALRKTASARQAS